MYFYPRSWKCYIFKHRFKENSLAEEISELQWALPWQTNLFVFISMHFIAAVDESMHSKVICWVCFMNGKHCWNLPFSYIGKLVQFWQVTTCRVDLCNHLSLHGRCGQVSLDCLLVSLNPHGLHLSKSIQCPHSYLAVSSMAILPRTDRRIDRKRIIFRCVVIFDSPFTVNVIIQQVSAHVHLPLYLCR